MSIYGSILSKYGLIMSLYGSILPLFVGNINEAPLGRISDSLFDTEARFPSG